MKWESKERREYVKNLSCLKQAKLIDLKNERESRDKSYYKFLEDSDSFIVSGKNKGSTASISVFLSQRDLEILRYLNNKDISLKRLIKTLTLQ